MRRKLFLSVFIVLLLSLTACGANGDQKADEGLEKVTVVLDYVPNTNHTGIYVALEQGLYEEAGLDVEIIEPTDGVTEVLIAQEQGDFGISYQEDVIYALDQEDPLPIQAIATIIQHNTSGFASYEGKEIKSPKDFEGKIYSGWGSPSEEAIIQAVMEDAGADFSKVSMVTSDGSGYASLKDKVDLMWFYWAWDGIASELDGIPVNYIELKELDSRLDYYTPIIISNLDLIDENPALIKQFMEATSKGYQFAIDNPAEAAEILHAYVPEYDLEMLVQSQEYLADKYSEDADVWGAMKDEVWLNYMEFMAEYDLIEREIPVEAFYTNEFLLEESE